MFASSRAQGGLNSLWQAVSQASSEPPLDGDSTRNVRVELLDDIESQTGDADVELSGRMSDLAAHSEPTDGQNKKARTMYELVKDASKEFITPRTRKDYERFDARIRSQSLFSPSYRLVKQFFEFAVKRDFASSVSDSKSEIGRLLDHTS